MRMDAEVTGCEVIGCTEPATDAYLYARGTRLLEFGVCGPHFARLQKGERPAVMPRRLGLDGDDGRLGLVLEAP